MAAYSAPRHSGADDGSVTNWKARRYLGSGLGEGSRLVAGHPLIEESERPTPSDEKDGSGPEGKLGIGPIAGSRGDLRDTEGGGVGALIPNHRAHNRQPKPGYGLAPFFTKMLRILIVMPSGWIAVNCEASPYFSHSGPKPAITGPRQKVNRFGFLTTPGSH
ncbi:hypothetical protein SAMN03159463_05070 [Mesorhizobium sp. NFR06]|nr:hypothetical protein SAMN03159463_05070 [Mesorhizobium sp. NFR06]